MCVCPGVLQGKGMKEREDIKHMDDCLVACLREGMVVITKQSQGTQKQDQLLLAEVQFMSYLDVSHFIFHYLFIYIFESSK